MHALKRLLHRCIHLAGENKKSSAILLVSSTLSFEVYMDSIFQIILAELQSELGNWGISSEENKMIPFSAVTAINPSQVR